MINVDIVFAGGGVKAIAFVGALKALSQSGIEIERVAGTSAGALTAALVKSNFTAEEIESYLNDLDMKKLLDPRPLGVIFPFLRWVELYSRMGIYKGEAFEHWVQEILEKKGVQTFGDLPEGSLKMVASDLSNGRFIIIPDDLHHYGIAKESFSIAKAVRMSSSLPFWFEPVKIKNKNGVKSIIVDGGVLSNFPLWIFKKKDEVKRERPILGLRLSAEFENIPPRKITNGLSMLHSMFDTMRTAHDQRYVAKADAKNVIFIPIQKVSSTQFDLTKKDKEYLISLGEKTTEDFLRKWSY